MTGKPLGLTSGPMPEVNPATQDTFPVGNVPYHYGFFLKEKILRSHCSFSEEAAGDELVDKGDKLVYGDVYDI